MIHGVYRLKEFSGEIPQDILLRYEFLHYRGFISIEWIRQYLLEIQILGLETYKYKLLGALRFEFDIFTYWVESTPDDYPMIIPSSVFDLDQLESLYLWNVNILFLPDYIDRIQNLKRLVISHCNLQSIPDEIVKLINLEVLKLDDNNLQSLPDLTPLLNLKELSVNNNKLSCLPIQYLFNLKKLDANNNQVRYIDSLTQITHLHKVDISFNLINEFPSLPISLEYLNLQHNKLSSIPTTIFNQLRFLDIRDNPLQGLDMLFYTHAVDKLFYSNYYQQFDAPISYPKDEALGMYLYKFHRMIRKGLISEEWLDRFLLEIQILRLASIKNELLSGILEEQDGLSFSLSGRSGQDAIILPFSLFELQNLVKIELLDVKMDHLSHLIKHLGNLRVLRIINCRLSTLPDSISSLNSLEILNLERNKLSLLPETIGDLKNLREINLSQNNLLALPLSMKNLTELYFLNLSHNPLRSIPIYLQHLYKR
ncbi:MAG: leucine-rich repeat domain-containing protein [Candidatus Heimdallarchaeota archaeon]|nr:leucine-rich repeat domain-containing protein [Candidatus Heimdallarchaeota archaeon]